MKKDESKSGRRHKKNLKDKKFEKKKLNGEQKD
jgi:hypothetical protein